jgi:ABC-2 type transport system ATP-binding protein
VVNPDDTSVARIDVISLSRLAREFGMKGKEAAMVTTAHILTMHPRPAAGAQQVARMIGVSKNFGQVQALADFNFEVSAGELVALLGPNGAGKTTAIKLLLGLANPKSGKVRVFGGDPASVATHMRVGAMLQVGRVPETLRVWEHVDLFSSYYPNPLPITETLAIAGLEGVRNRKFGDLSGGQKQRVLFALAVCGNPDLLFLDEPTVGLDVEARHLLWDEIRNLLRRGKTVVLTTHYLEEADALADRIGVINKGSIIAEGTPAQIKARTAGKKIRCVTQLRAAVIQDIPEVLDVNHDREAMVIHTANAESVLRRLLTLDQTISGIEVTSAGLEEAFLSLTRNGSAENALPRQL